MERGGSRRVRSEDGANKRAHQAEEAPDTHSLSCQGWLLSEVVGKGSHRVGKCRKAMSPQIA